MQPTFPILETSHDHALLFTAKATPSPISQCIHRQSDRKPVSKTLKALSKNAQAKGAIGEDDVEDMLTKPQEHQEYARKPVHEQGIPVLTPPDISADMVPNRDSDNDEVVDTDIDKDGDDHRNRPMATALPTP
ncbi:hypothetical protein HGRIS_014679 [Hohenbuehelia grisea]|uniref:Uncharacterized protein n=1 Tax=Hohenbuehelia grisea TaxID=104357 RepID=A0ABR3JU64_9AGAR